MTAKECLLKNYSLREEQIEVTVIGIEERSGKVIEKMEMKKVRLTIDNGNEDIEALKEYGRIILRQIKIERITDEAIEQGGGLSQEDLSKYLSCTVNLISERVSMSFLIPISTLPLNFLSAFCLRTFFLLASVSSFVFTNLPIYEATNVAILEIPSSLFG